MENSSGLDFGSAMTFFADLANSMVADPLFYLKVVGIIVLAVIILGLSYELIAGS